MEKILEEIKKVITDYGKLSESATINQLLVWKDKLIGYNYYLAEELAGAKRAYNFSYYIRKIGVCTAKNNHISKGMAISKAESIATEEQADKMQEELENESYAYKLEILLRQSNKVVDAMQQRISVLKIEQNNSRNENQT